MGGKRKTNDMSSTDEIKIVPPVDAVGPLSSVAEQTGEGASSDGVTTDPAEKKAVTKKSHARSAKYRATRAQIDKTKKYDAFAAIELVKKLSYTKFVGTITAHAVVKEVGMTASLTLPHSSGKTVRVTIVTDDVLKDIQDGKLDFDVLVAAPQFMPKLARFAPVLGPKGLMPNPKNGTLTPNPEGAKKKLEAGTATIKTEKKAPLMHLQIGKTSMDTKQLVENLEAIMKSLSTQLVSLAIAASMSPGIKVAIVSEK
jgi:large subunit ribosomal protein L1